MHLDQLQPAGIKPSRDAPRKEWSGGGASDTHQTEALEHARTAAKSLKCHGIREAEAQHQIRELRRRY